jgi:hypothetical protein
MKATKTNKGYEGRTPSGKPFLIWKDTRSEFVQRGQFAYERKCNQWIMNIDGKKIEGLGTKRQALEIAEKN